MPVNCKIKQSDYIKYEPLTTTDWHFD